MGDYEPEILVTFIDPKRLVDDNQPKTSESVESIAALTAALVQLFGEHCSGLCARITKRTHVPS